MTDEFDPYQQWLGIAKHEQPPNHYRLLGVGELMDDVEAIGNAVDRQMNFVHTFQLGKHAELSQKIMRELAEAKLCLLNPATKAVYDEGLREQKRPPAAPAPPRPAAPAAKPPAPAPPKPAAPAAKPPAPTPPAVVETVVAQPAPNEFASPRRTHREPPARSGGGVPNWAWMGLAAVLTLVVVIWVVVQISGSRQVAEPKGSDREKPKSEKPQVSSRPTVVQSLDGSVKLPAVMAEAFGDHAARMTAEGETFITGLQSLGDGATWEFDIEKGKRGLFLVVVDYACPRSTAGGEFAVTVNGTAVKGTHRVRETGDATGFRRAEIGHIKIQKLDGNVLKLVVKSPVDTGTTIMNVRAVRLKLLQKGKG